MFTFWPLCAGVTSALSEDTTSACTSSINGVDGTFDKTSSSRVDQTAEKTLGTMQSSSNPRGLEFKYTSAVTITHVLKTCALHFAFCTL